MAPGIDRSAKMIAAARGRNAAHVEAGTAEFLTASLEEADLGDRRFDHVFAVRVGLFHREPVSADALGPSGGWPRRPRAVRDSTRPGDCARPDSWHSGTIGTRLVAALR